MNYLLSDQTKSDIEGLLAENGGSSIGYGGSVGGGNVVMVRVTAGGTTVDGWYPARVVIYRTGDGWDVLGECYVKEANDRTLTEDVYYLGLRTGYVSGKPGFITTNCCGDAAPGITTACCPENVLPLTLTATISNTTGDCTCSDGSSFLLTWDGSFWRYDGPAPTPCGGTFVNPYGTDEAYPPMHILFWCDGTDWTINLEWNYSATNTFVANSVSCSSPLEIVFEGAHWQTADLSPSVRCSGTFTLTVTV